MKLRNLFLFSALTIGALMPLSAKTSNVLDLKHSITDNAIVFPETYEQDTQKLLEGWYMKTYTASDNRYKNASDPNTSDQVIIERLSTLPTAIDLPFNQIVRSYIDRYTKKGRAGVAAMLGLSHYYMPIFEQALEEAGLPLELKYLPVIESGLNPNAVSRMGATGLWQFMLSAAKGYNLEVNSLVDERRDPYQSSRAAAAFLKDLYSTYGDWSLVIAAYNCGPGNVNKALRRAGGDASTKDFWAIYPYLPAETRGYVPMFIAATYVMNYYPEHNISPVLATKPLVTDTVAVDSRVHFNQISKVLDIPMDELRILNPQFRTDLIPGSSKKSYMLILPSQQIHAYLMSEKEIKEYDADKYARRVVAEPGKGASALNPDDELAFEPGTDSEPQELAPNPADEELAEDIAQMQQAARTSGNKKVYTHQVQEGESLESIAEVYGVTKSEIKVQNNLRREAVRVGQELRISTSKEVARQKVSDTAPRQEQTASTNRTSSRSNRNTTAETNTTAQTNTTKARARDSKKTETAQQPTNNKNTAAKNTKKSQQETTRDAGKNKQQTAKSNKNKQETAQSNKSSKNSKSNKKETAQTSSKKNEHGIKEGETLSSISKKYGVSVEEIKKANGMKNDNIRAGKSLTIPSKKKETTKSSSSKSSSKSSGSKSSKRGSSKSKKR